MVSLAHGKRQVKDDLLSNPTLAHILSPPLIEAFSRQAGHEWRRSFWSPSVTVLTFLVQVLDGAKTLRAAVAWLLTLLAGRYWPQVLRARLPVPEHGRAAGGRLAGRLRLAQPTLRAPGGPVRCPGHDRRPPGLHHTLLGAPGLAGGPPSATRGVHHGGQELLRRPVADRRAQRHPHARPELAAFQHRQPHEAPAEAGRRPGRRRPLPPPDRGHQGRAAPRHAHRPGRRRLALLAGG